MTTVRKKSRKDTVSYFSRAKEFFSGLFDLSTSNPGALLTVVGLTGSVAVPSTLYIPNLLTAPASQIIGEMSSYSPDGWPIINNTTVRLSGVSPIAASKRDQFAAWIRSHGGNLECNSSDHGLTYRCLTPRLDVIQGIPLTQIKGAVSSYSSEGWPIINNTTTVRLSGVGPIEASKRNQFAAWIRSHGGYLECDSSNDGDAYRCLTAQRLDVAQALLLNGATHANADADPHYKEAEKTQNRIAGSLR
jgi:hypothetical protein